MVATAIVAAMAAAQAESGQYRYLFNVGPDGAANVTITYVSRTSGSTWLLVPRDFASWSMEVASGRVVHEELEEARPIRYAFYLNYSFTFTVDPEGLFNASITYTSRYAAFIEEPRGFFYSTQVSCSPMDEVEVDVALPPGSSRLVHVYGSSSYAVEEVGGRVLVRVVGRPKDGRVAIEFAVPGVEARMVEVREDGFKVKAAARYYGLAEEVLRVYVEAQPTLSRIFNVSLEGVEVRLYVPTIDDVLSGVGGYVPFTGGRPGVINLNVFYVRAVEGSLELIALHELIHHYLWRVGIPPERLWVHEGLAEYLSIEVGRAIGLGRGVEGHEARLLRAARGLRSLGFIQSWTFDTPGDLAPYYAASYRVFKALGDRYGGLDYYRRFFEHVRSMGGVEGDEDVVRCLSMAAGVDLTDTFEAWGFSFERGAVEAVLEAKPSWCQPAKLVAEALLELSRQIGPLRRGLRGAAAIVAANAEVFSILAYSVIAVALALASARPREPR
ncbi:hypothetical protein B6U99_07585 [Candidatus Geothermarchaeota archaeon ex4572_27]|nr:MAG: hypothetical protein B6U99_07585 [Candidatus Geothermarchaeota archaeon ex4572_27]